MFLKDLIIEPKDCMILPTEDLVILSLSGKAISRKFCIWKEFPKKNALMKYFKSSSKEIQIHSLLKYFSHLEQWGKLMKRLLPHCFQLCRYILRYHDCQPGWKPGSQHCSWNASCRWQWVSASYLLCTRIRQFQGFQQVGIVMRQSLQQSP